MVRKFTCHAVHLLRSCDQLPPPPRGVLGRSYGFASVSVLPPEVVFVLCHNHGVHVHAEGGHEVQSAEEDVGQLDGDPLRLARTVRALRPWLAHSVAYGEILAILLGEGTRPINEWGPVPIFLQGLGEFGMDQTKRLGERGRLVSPSMSDGVVVDLFR